MIGTTILILGLVAVSQAKQYVTCEERRINNNGDGANVMTLRIPPGQCTGELLTSMIPCDYVSLLGIEVRDDLPGAVVQLTDDLSSGTVTRTSPCSNNAAFIVRYVCADYNHHPNGVVKRVTEPEQDKYALYTKRPAYIRNPYRASWGPIVYGHKLYRPIAPNGVRYRKDVEYKAPTPKLACANARRNEPVENNNTVPPIKKV